MKNQIGYTIFFASVVVACWAMRTNFDQDVIAQTRVATSEADLAQPMIESKEVAGLSIGIVSLDPSGKLISETQHFGHATGSRSAEAQSATDETLYEIGGLSKAFTGILLANSIHRGEVKLSTPAAELMPPGVTMPSHGDCGITLLDLAIHRSGLPRIADNMPFSKTADPYWDYTSQLAGEFLNQHKLLRAPGKHHEYSNLGMSYLGCLLTRKSGADSYDAMLLDRLTGPLGMSSTKVELNDDQSRLAVGHTEKGAEATPWHCADTPGAGGIHASIADMNRFMIANLKPSDDDSVSPLIWRFKNMPNRLVVNSGWGWDGRLLATVRLDSVTVKPAGFLQRYSSTENSIWASVF